MNKILKSFNHSQRNISTILASVNLLNCLMIADIYAAQYVLTELYVQTPTQRVDVIKEKEDDDRILECALEGKAQYVISGDKRHLLPLKEYQGIRILPPTEFLKVISFNYNASQ